LAAALFISKIIKRACILSRLSKNDCPFAVDNLRLPIDYTQAFALRESNGDVFRDMQNRQKAISYHLHGIPNTLYVNDKTHGPTTTARSIFPV
jgi:hypothetical protein